MDMQYFEQLDLTRLNYHGKTDKQFQTCIGLSTHVVNLFCIYLKYLVRGKHKYKGHFYISF